MLYLIKISTPNYQSWILLVECSDAEECRFIVEEWLKDEELNNAHITWPWDKSIYNDSIPDKRTFKLDDFQESDWGVVHEEYTGG